MQHTLIYPPLNAVETEGSPAFSVLIAYEDFETGKLAKRTYDFLVENLGRDCEFVNQMWKFDVLGIPKLRDIAVEDATRADIIILSSHGDELPGHVKVWIESWLEKALNPLALVALLEPAGIPESVTNSTRSYLADVARRGGMEFFAQPDSPCSPNEEMRFSACPSEGERLDNRTLSTLAGVVRRDTALPRWGINE